MDERQETIEDIVAEIRAIWRGCEDCSCNDLTGADILEISDRIKAAVRREAESIERIIRDAVIDYSMLYINAPNDDAKRELKDRAAIANAWLVAHGFEGEPVIWSKEEVPCL